MLSPLYLILCIYAIFKGRSRGAALLFSGVIVGLVHYIVYLIDLEPTAAYWAFFMIAFGWFFVVSALRCFYAEISIGAMCLFLLVNAIDVMNNPDKSTVISDIYSVIILMCNIGVMAAGINDKRRIDTIRFGNFLLFGNRKAHVHGGKGGHR